MQIYCHAISDLKSYLFQIFIDIATYTVVDTNQAMSEKLKAQLKWEIKEILGDVNLETTTAKEVK